MYVVINLLRANISEFLSILSFIYGRYEPFAESLYIHTFLVEPIKSNSV